MTEPETPDDDVTTSDGGSPDMTSASREEIADLVDNLEKKVLAETGNPQDKIADDARESGTDRADGEVEPPV